MKISFILQDLVHGGAQYVTALMIRGFIAKGYDVDLIVSQVHKTSVDMGANPFDIPKETNLIYLPYKQARKNIFAIRKYLKKTTAIAVIAMSSNYTFALRLAAIGLRKIPSLYHVEHGIPGTKGLYISPPISRWSFKRLTNLIFYSKFKAILTVCEGGRKNFIDLTRLPKNKIIMVSNPVIDDIFYEKIKESPKHPWLKNKICPTFVSAGMHTPLKGHKMLLEVFNQLSKERSVRLIIFGRGELTEQYQEYIREHKLEDVVSLPGFTNNLPAELQAADALLVASWTESFSIVLVEALATKIPIISTDCNYGPREILLNGKYGKLVPVNNKELYYNAIKDFLNGINLIKNEDKEAWQRYTVEKIVSNYERALGLL